MENKKVKLIIGFIAYGKSTAKYLPYFLPSLKSQTFKDFKLIAFDNTEEAANENINYIENNYPEIKIIRTGENIGFAKAYNRMIKKAAVCGAEYFLAINPDMTLEADAVEKLAAALDGDKGLGSVSPKVLKWDFKNNIKTDIIDTCGIVLKSGLRFIDAGQALADRGQFDNIDILGPSGAAAMFRVSALEKIKKAGQCFDELMFMYKEDCDLVYRLKLKGYKSKCVSGAIIYHDRTAFGEGERDIKAAMNRKKKSRQIKGWSFLNQHIIFLKYWGKQDLLNKLAIVWYAFKMLIFVLIFEQYLLKKYFKLIKIRHKINL